VDEIQKFTYSNIKKANKLLGYIPRFSLLDGLASTVRWFSQEVYNNKDYRRYINENSTP